MILLISPDGMLGRAFVQLFREEGRAVRAISHPRIDITNVESVREHLDRTITTVINCAAFTDVDGAESREEDATRINAVGVGNLAARCVEFGSTLVHFGTDYVFSGRASSPYPVDAPIEPQSAYGRSKAEGEVALSESGAVYLYLRTSWLYAPWGKNFVRTIANAARTRDTLRVVDDQRGRPTSAEHLARTTLALLELRARGIFHVTDGGECSWFEFAREIVRLSGATATVEPCSSAEYPSKVQRPAYSVLDLSKTEALVGPMPEWQKNLAAVIPRIE